MAKIASAINVPFGRWRSYDTAAFLNSKALEMFFLHKFVKPSSVKCACFNSSDVMKEHNGMGLERSSKRHLESQ